ANVGPAVKYSRLRRRRREGQRAHHENVVPLRTERQEIRVSKGVRPHLNSSRRVPRRMFGRRASATPRRHFGPGREPPFHGARSTANVGKQGHASYVDRRNSPSTP